MKERIYINEKLRKRLEESLNTSADYLDKIGNIVKTNFKGAKWCTSFLWALEQYPDLRAYYLQKLYKDTAEEMGLECWIGADIIPTEEVKLNRRLVELQIAPSQKAIKEYKITPEIKAFLCTGAIYIDKGGAIKIATNATDLIADYCSVFVENAKEMAFVKNLTALQDAANKLEKCYQDFKDQVRNKGAINSVNWRKRDFNIAKIHICDSLPLMSDSTLCRAFVSLCLIDNPKKTPHFYNGVGKPKISIEELHALSGYLPTATPELCVKFPKLYPVSSLRKTSKEAEDAIKNVKERIKEDKYLIDERGLIEMNPAKCITPKYAVIYPEID